MIRHIALFKLRAGISWDEPRTRLAVEYANRVGHEVPALLSWYAGRNISDRPVAYDFVVMGTVRDQDDLDDYLEHPFHRQSVALWREISDWVVADLVEEEAFTVRLPEPEGLNGAVCPPVACPPLEALGHSDIG